MHGHKNKETLNGRFTAELQEKSPPDFFIPPPSVPYEML